MAETAAPLPDEFDDEGELAAIDRLFSSESVVEQGLLAPHIERAAQRAGSVGDILVLHDTTEFTFAASGG